MIDLESPDALLREAIGGFFRALERDPVDGAAGLRRLALSLDNLVSIYFQLEAVDPSSEVEAPTFESSALTLAKTASAAFPELGLYPWADPGGDPGDEECAVADAIDDLADIAKDLIQVMWYLDNATLSDAIWDFRFGYQSHWGPHLHSLRAYLNSSRIAVW